MYTVSWLQTVRAENSRLLQGVAQRAPGSD
jgi:hypothetical protein